ncbi:MAG: polyprenyl synthetase family protein [Candidatus Marinimicrobia bacterium]|nr:polyprenyl synthetase family protein [Candidatus Neomarinimicrobiota bacterium]
MKFNTYYSDYIPWFDRKLKRSIQTPSPASLYAPIQYVLNHSGKQLRPSILSAVAEVFGNVSKKESFAAASSVEMMHNFTLIHDDIMDDDLLRHGKETVHKKWNKNKAILSGDGLFTIALSQLNYYTYNPKMYVRLIPKLLNAVIKVCEGQAEDMEFEQRNDVHLDEYLDMVTKKTAYLLAISGRLGAIIGGASEAEEKQVEAVLLQLGIVFQIQDDLLELTSNSENMGKTLGSDLIKQKKTYPYLYAKQELSEDTWQIFLELIQKDVILKHGIKPACELLKENFIFDRIHEVIKLRNETIQNMIKDLPARTQEMFYSIVLFIMNRGN